MDERTAPARVDWRNVGLFYAVALGGAIVVATGIWLITSTLGSTAALLATGLTALLYMPIPLVAGLVVERVAGRGYLIGREWRALRGRFWRSYGRNALVAVALVLAIVTAALVAAWLAGAAGLPGAGRLIRDDAELHARMIELTPALAAVPELPGIPVIAGAGILQGMLAGLTINGLFAVGEEYGWRGVLADELRPLGRVRATLLTGVLWGLWHAPIIMLGHNYGAEWRWGIVVMVAWTTPLSFLLTWARDRTGSVLAPSLLHGGYNGVIGIFLYLVTGGSVLIAVPMGVLMGVTLAVLAAAVWRLPASGRAG